jgi:Rod binding domain-containing protein
VSDISGISSVTGPVTMPADVRKAGKDGEDTYRAALGFERQMIEELTKTMSKDLAGTSSAGDGSDDGSGDSGGDAATSAYSDMLPGTLADSLTSAGGLGLAHDLWLSMRSTQS